MSEHQSTAPNSQSVHADALRASKGQAVPPDANQMALESTSLAFERTILAWVRTALSLIGFGFTISKFFATLADAINLARSVWTAGHRDDHDCSRSGVDGDRHLAYAPVPRVLSIRAPFGRRHTCCGRFSVRHCCLDRGQCPSLTSDPAKITLGRLEHE